MLSERFILNNNKLPVPYPELVWDPPEVRWGNFKEVSAWG